MRTHRPNFAPTAPTVCRACGARLTVVILRGSRVTYCATCRPATLKGV